MKNHKKGPCAPCIGFQGINRRPGSRLGKRTVTTDATNEYSKCVPKDVFPALGYVNSQLLHKYEVGNYTARQKRRVCEKANDLPEYYKEILVLRKHYQLTQSEIAIKLDLSKKQIEDCISYIIRHCL